jgi:hypothetical protein
MRVAAIRHAPSISRTAQRHGSRRIASVTARASRWPRSEQRSPPAAGRLRRRAKASRLCPGERAACRVD